MKQPTLEAIKRDVLSPDPYTRGSAMQALSMRAREDASVHAMALPIFRAAIAEPKDAWSIGSALAGIRAISGDGECRAAAVRLLELPDSSLVSRIVLWMSDPMFAGDLIAIMRRRLEAPIQTAAMRVLGRMRAVEAFDLIFDNLSKRELRCDAIEALGELGDARAIALLEPLVADDTPGRDDDRGYPLRIGDLAAQSIRQIQQKLKSP